MRLAVLALGLAAVAATASACSRGDRDVEPVAASEPSVPPTPPPASPSPSPSPDAAPGKRLATATFGGGCFWCTEAVYRRLEGVASVESGYAGGRVENPTYKQVCGGDTGHAEVIQVTYDPAKVSYADLLEVFWKTHDPTTKDRQGNDVGSQYRSIVLVHDDEQRRVAEDLRARLDAAKVFDAPIVTEIVPYDRFWKAEEYHQDYFADNPNQPYCRAVVGPKVAKFEKVFKERLKKP